MLNNVQTGQPQNEQDLRRIIRTALSQKQPLPGGSDVKGLVDEIRRKYGLNQSNDLLQQPGISAAQPFNRMASTSNSGAVEGRKSGFYRLMKRINLRFRQMDSYERRIAPIAEGMKKGLPSHWLYQNSISFRQLLAGGHEEFINNSYRSLLGREADVQGLDNYLQLLLQSKGDRVYLLGCLRYSAEGKRYGVPVAGLWLRYMIKRWKNLMMKIPLIGYLFRGVKDILLLPRKLDSLLLTTCRHSYLLEKQQAEYQATLAMFQTKVESLRTEILSSTREAQAIQRSVETRTEQLREQLEQVAAKSARTSEEWTGYLQEITADKEENKRKEQTVSALYLQFENRFRGSREEILQRLKVYLAMVEDLDRKNGHNYTDVLDLGCGRGEWLELLKQNRFNCYGIDISEEMVATCHSLNLRAEQIDALQYLKKLPDESVFVVTGFHLVEHMAIVDRFDLLTQVRRVLKRGGFTIFETPNPENLIVGACNFYLDYSHTRPIPPEQLRFMAEQAGFDRVDIYRLHPYNAIELQQLSAGNDEIRNIAGFFNAMSDYSILAFKE